VTPQAYRAQLEQAWAAHLAPREAGAPTVASLFAGCGGSSLGYSMAGYREVFASDFDPHACATLRLNFPGVTVREGDVAGVQASEILRAGGLRAGELDVLDGSPPCQGFSTAGRREFGDQRNRLFLEYARLVREVRPRAIVMENVSGMVKGKMRVTFAEVLAGLRACGYRVRARLMNAQHYGVPQHRERIIFVGVRADLAAEPSHPEPQTRPIPSRDAVDWGADPPDLADVPPLAPRSRGRYARVPQGASASDLPESGGKWFTNIMKVSPARPCMTIPKSHNGRGWGTVVHPTKPRAISVSEGMALSSFPPAFRIDGDYNDRFSRLGNSVPPLLMRAIAQHVRGILQQADQAGAA
jgi:DNA (cytosine-5)-methyltransferase 1